MQSAKTSPGADCGSDHELLIAKFRLKLKKVGKTTRPSSYDLNQIPYNYTVEVTNRFKGWDLIEYLKNYGQRFVTLYQRQWPRLSPRKRNAKRQNGCLRLSELRKEEKLKAKGKRKDISTWMQSSKARRVKKAFLSDQCKEIEENNRMGKTRDLFKNIRIQREHFMQNRHNKGQERYGPNRSTRYLEEVVRIHRRTIQEKIFMTQITMLVWSVT